MKIIMYGTGICPDCVEAKTKLDTCSDIELDYRDITKDTKTLKEFLAYRDHEKIFAPIIENGGIGIPFFLLEDGTKTFELEDFTDIEKSESAVEACSIDGKGYC